MHDCAIACTHLHLSSKYEGVSHGHSTHESQQLRRTAAWNSGACCGAQYAFTLTSALRSTIDVTAARQRTAVWATHPQLPRFAAAATQSGPHCPHACVTGESGLPLHHNRRRICHGVRSSSRSRDGRGSTRQTPSTRWASVYPHVRSGDCGDARGRIHSGTQTTLCGMPRLSSLAVSRGVDHGLASRAQRDPSLLRLREVTEVANLALHEELLPADLILATIVVPLRTKHACQARQNPVRSQAAVGADARRPMKLATHAGGRTWNKAIESL